MGKILGIDLGTSQASISASNGVREVVPTYVGYPKDNISNELLGDEPLFGELALKHRLSVELVRPLAKGVIQSNGDKVDDQCLQASQQLVQYLLKKARPLPGQPVYGVIGAPARASVHRQRVLIDAAKGILDSVMITSEPFSVAYGLDVLNQALVIDMGAGTVDLCRLHGTMPEEEDQITLEELLHALRQYRYEERRSSGGIQAQMKIVNRLILSRMMVLESKKLGLDRQPQTSAQLLANREGSLASIIGSDASA